MGDRLAAVTLLALIGNFLLPAGGWLEFSLQAASGQQHAKA